MFGPVFTREVVIAPRRSRLYIVRTAYAAGLLLLVATAWLVLTGTQIVRDLGDAARFGTLVFQILAPLQLALAMFFSATLAAAAVAQEKDRRTLVLLLLTNLTNGELVLGKLMAALLQVLVMLAAGLPVLMMVALLGGVSFGQIARAMAVTVASVLVCGSLGSTLALWREKAFQALALTVLVVVLWLALGEVLASGVLGHQWAGVPAHDWAASVSPWRAILDTCRVQPQAETSLGALASPFFAFLAMAATASIALNALAVAKVRFWNTVREERSGDRAADRAAAEAAQNATDRPVARTREVWDNPILWREIRTSAYGRKMLVLRAVYLALFGLAAWSLFGMISPGRELPVAQGAVALVPLLLLSLVLVTTQAVTALTSERDVRALDLLLVTDLTPREIVFGKLGGVFYNVKEMVVLPMALCGYLAVAGAVSLDNALYLLGGLAVLYGFAAVLGIHAGMIYENSRAAIGTSLGTVFFLFVGVAVCMRIMLAFSGSFNAQLQPFLAFMLGGGLGLYVALGSRNPSTAIGVASFACPFATFYAITSFLLGATLNVFLVTAATYGFTTAAMLIPALYEFDVISGKASAEE